MPTRERWIVYPLLFLTLGMVLRDKVAPPQLEQLDADEIRCKSLSVVGPNGQPCLILDDASGAGQLAVYGQNGQIMLIAGVVPKGNAGYVDLQGPNRKPSVQLTSNSYGGTISLFDRTGQIEVILGHEHDSFGLFGTSPNSSIMPIPLQLIRWSDILRKLAPEKN
ncbi:MAG: hypothetical protein JW818_04875 [Pirellulales bacterium]|nr:hypothetical protein [Pirellulales bacterium]